MSSNKSDYLQYIQDLYLHQYQFVFEVKEKILLPKNYFQFLGDGLKKALNDVEKARTENFVEILHTPNRVLYAGMRSPKSILEDVDETGNHPFIVSRNHPSIDYLKKYDALPWWVQPVQDLVKNTHFQRGQFFGFSFFIAGHFNKIWEASVWMDVLLRWTEINMGIIGLPPHSFQLRQVDELHPKGDRRIIYQGGEQWYSPSMPISVSDFPIINTQQVDIQLLSPTVLSKYYTAFSFNYLSERILKRILCLQALYCGSGKAWIEQDGVGYFQLYGYEKQDDKYFPILEGTQKIITQDIHVRFINIYHQSPNIKKGNKKFELQGYKGNLRYVEPERENDLLGFFVPLLKLGEYLNVGERIRYGNGWIKSHV